jgi:hypothetical protein
MKEFRKIYSKMLILFLGIITGCFICADMEYAIIFIMITSMYSIPYLLTLRM